MNMTPVSRTCVLQLCAGSCLCNRQSFTNLHLSGNLLTKGNGKSLTLQKGVNYRGNTGFILASTHHAGRRHLPHCSHCVTGAHADLLLGASSSYDYHLRTRAVCAVCSQCYTALTPSFPMCNHSNKVGCTALGQHLQCCLQWWLADANVLGQDPVVSARSALVG